MAINRPNDRFSNRAFRLQASTPPAIEHLSFASPDSCTERTAEPSSLEQAMIPQQAMSNDPLSPHTPADADEYPPVNQARCSNKLLEHLEHLHETNDLFGNVAKSQNLRQTNVSTTAPCGISVPKEQIEEILKKHQ